MKLGFGGSHIHPMALTPAELEEAIEDPQSQEIDSKYRLIILAAKRSKQLQRGARPRIDIDPTKHKVTRIALEEVISGKVKFHWKTDGEEPQEEG